MNKYDEEYFFIEKIERDGLPFLTPDTNTEDRPFTHVADPVGSPPFVFINGLRERHKNRGVKALKSLPDVLFSGADLVVHKKIREKLLQENIPHLHMHPTVYVHDDGVWHEDYWYMTFTETFDCWDRSNSSYEKKPLEIGGANLHSVYTYSLNEALIDKTPMDQRKIFKMGGTQDGYIVANAPMTKHFSSANGVGLKFTKISDY